MKQPNLIFPCNAAMQCRYEGGKIEYLPHNGNAFDSSASEFNLRAADASGTLSVRLYVFLSAPFCTFLLSSLGFLEALSKWTQLSAPWNFNLLLLFHELPGGSSAQHCCPMRHPWRLEQQRRNNLRTKQNRQPLIVRKKMQRAEANRLYHEVRVTFANLII